VSRGPKDGFSFEIARYLFEKAGYVFEKVGYLFLASCRCVLATSSMVNNI
jgi:hypothetical protein